MQGLSYWNRHITTWIWVVSFLIACTRIIGIGKLVTSIWLGNIWKPTKLHILQTNTWIYDGVLSVFESDVKSIIPSGVSHTQEGFPKGGWQACCPFVNPRKRLRKATKYLVCFILKWATPSINTLWIL